MVADYLLYLSTLPVEERNEKLLIIEIFFLILLAICSILAFLKIQFMDEKKDNLFQKFLKKI